MKQFRLPLSLVLLISLLFIFAYVPVMVEANEPDALALQDVWNQVYQSGSYAFRADLTQTISRDRGGVAYGSSTEKSRVYMEGETNLESGFLDLTLWSNGGSVLLPESGTQIRIADGQALARRGNGTR